MTQQTVNTIAEMMGMDIVALLAVLFAVMTMFAIGLGVTVTEALAPLRNRLAALFIVGANNVVVPLFAILLLLVLSGRGISATAEVGLFRESRMVADLAELRLSFLFLMLAAGTFLGPTLARLSGVPETFAKGSIVLLIVATAILAPIELLLVEGLGIVNLREVSVATLFSNIVVYQLLPLAAGMAIRARYAPVAETLRPVVTQARNLSMIGLIALLLVLGASSTFFSPAGELQMTPEYLLALTGPYVILVVIAVIMLFIGYFAGRAVGNVAGVIPIAITRSLATATTVRNLSFALILQLAYSAASGERMAPVDALQFMIIFYLIALAISAHQAVQWGKAEASEEVPPEIDPAALLGDLGEQVTAVLPGGGE